MNVLVIAAHPDDEALGCGATMSRLRREGHSVHLAIMSTGDWRTRRRGVPEEASWKGRRRQQAQRAADYLGVTSYRFLDWPDQLFERRLFLDLVQDVESLLEWAQPEVVVTHWGGDLNLDHSLLHQAVVTATRPQPGCVVRTVLGMEVASSTEWAFGNASLPFCPQVFVEVSPLDVQAKLNALACYVDERREFPHPRSPEAEAALARWRGATIGVEMAEAFALTRSLWPFWPSP